jgi:uncharacterized lipoprotein YmbA
MMRRRSALGLALAAGMFGCASPDPALYTLGTVPGPAQTGTARSVELRRVSLAGYLDRPEIVRSAAQYRLTVLANERWGEPFGSMLDRVLVEDLVERLPRTSVFTESGAISTRPDIILEIDIQRFDADADGTVVLLAQVAVRHDQNNVAADARTFRFTVAPASSATQDYVAAMSKALGQLADQVALMVTR